MVKCRRQGRAADQDVKVDDVAAPGVVPAAGVQHTNA